MRIAIDTNVRVPTDFDARCDASLAEYERTGVSVPLDVVLAKLEAMVAARVQQAGGSGAIRSCDKLTGG